MHELWSSASYEPHAWSLAFAFAPAAMSIVIAYAIVMKGAAALRGWLLLHFAALLPYAVCIMLSPSTVSASAAEAWLRIGGACVPMAAAGGAGFQFALLGKPRRARWLLAFAFTSAAAWIALGATSDLVISGVRRIPFGMWFANAGPWAWLALVTTLISSVPGFIAMAAAAFRGAPSLERRQLRLVLAANLTTYAGLLDVLLAYDIGWFPVGWLLSGIGSLLVVRALLVEDLLRARAFDTTAPRLVLHFVVATFLAFATLALLGPALPWWAVGVALGSSFAGARVTIAVIGLVNRGGRMHDDTFARLVGQLVTRTRGARDATDVARLAIDVIELGIGTRVEILLAAADDWGWTTADGTRVADDARAGPVARRLAGNGGRAWRAARRRADARTGGLAATARQAVRRSARGYAGRGREPGRCARAGRRAGYGEALTRSRARVRGVGRRATRRSARARAHGSARGGACAARARGRASCRGAAAAVAGFRRACARRCHGHRIVATGDALCRRFLGVSRSRWWARARRDRRCHRARCRVCDGDGSSRRRVRGRRATRWQRAHVGRARGCARCGGTRRRWRSARDDLLRGGARPERGTARVRVVRPHDALPMQGRGRRRGRADRARRPRQPARRRPPEHREGPASQLTARGSRRLVYRWCDRCAGSDGTGVRQRPPATFASPPRHRTTRTGEVHDTVHATLAAYRGQRTRVDDETVVVAQWQPVAKASAAP